MNTGRAIHDMKQDLLKELLSEIKDIVYPYGITDYDSGFEDGINEAIEIIKNKIDEGME